MEGSSCKLFRVVNPPLRSTLQNTTDQRGVHDTIYLPPFSLSPPPYPFIVTPFRLSIFSPLLFFLSKTRLIIILFLSSFSFVIFFTLSFAIFSHYLLFFVHIFFLILYPFLYYSFGNYLSSSYSLSSFYLVFSSAVSFSQSIYYYSLPLLNPFILISYPFTILFTIILPLSPSHSSHLFVNLLFISSYVLSHTLTLPSSFSPNLNSPLGLGKGKERGAGDRLYCASYAYHHNEVQAVGVQR